MFIYVSGEWMIRAIKNKKPVKFMPTEKLHKVKVLIS